jgi:hypothetical protein
MEYPALATFVAPLEQRTVAAASLAEGTRAKNRRFPVALVSALTLVAFGIHGYHPYAEDGGLYLAGVERLLDPGLFPHSTAFVLEPTRYSLFAPSVAVVVRISHVRLPAVLLALHLCSIWVTLYATWLLACRCWAERAARAGATMLAACWLSLPVAGTALAVMDPYLTARSLSTPCMVFALVGMLDATEVRASGELSRSRIRGIFLLLGSLTVAAVMHPLMAAYASAATLVVACVRSQSARVRIWGSTALTIAAFVIALCIEAAAKPESTAYRRIALTRSYWFPSEWAWYELVGLAAPLVMLAVCTHRSRLQETSQDEACARRSLYCMAIVAGITAWLIALLFARPMAPVYLVARLQPLRIFQIVYLIMTIMIGANLGRFVLRNRIGRWGGALLLLGSIMFVADRLAFPDSPHLELPRTTSRNGWLNAFRWIRDNTPKDALFALDPDYIHADGEDAQCFRAIAERSTLPDYSKDGGEASIAPGLTAAWIAGQQAQQGLNASSTTDAMRIAALQPVGVSWIVLAAQTSTRLSCPYANSAAKVCRLR